MSKISERIKTAMSIRNMRQADLVEKTKIGKSSISTYLSGAYEPKQKNIYKLAQALNVNEYWLLGYDVPMEKVYTVNVNNESNVKNVLFEITPRSLENSPRMLEALINFVLRLDIPAEIKGVNVHNYFINEMSIDEKAEVLNCLIDYAIYNPDEDKIVIAKLYDDADVQKRVLSMMTYSDETKQLIKYFVTLNEDGKRKVFDFISDISSMKKYTERGGL